MSETLYTHDIFHSMTATDVFAKDAGLMVARPKRGCMPCIMIPHGFHALVTYNGAEIEERRRFAPFVTFLILRKGLFPLTDDRPNRTSQ